MQKIKEYTFVIALAIISIMFIGCAGYVAVETNGTRVCSICEGRGYITEIDTRFLPDVIYVTVSCRWCGGRGIAIEPYYYLETGRIVYNYPYRRPVVGPKHHRHNPVPKPAPKPRRNDRNAIPGHYPRTNHNHYGGRR